MTLNELREALERDGWTSIMPLMISGAAVLIAHHRRVDINADDDNAEVLSDRGIWQFDGPSAHRAAYKRACKELARNHA